MFRGWDTTVLTRLDQNWMILKLHKMLYCCTYGNYWASVHVFQVPPVSPNLAGGTWSDLGLKVPPLQISICLALLISSSTALMAGRQVVLTLKYQHPWREQPAQAWQTSLVLSFSFFNFLVLAQKCRNTFSASLGQLEASSVMRNAYREII